LDYGNDSEIFANQIEEVPVLPQVQANNVADPELVESRYRNQFTLEIPKINLNKSVVENVHPGIKAEYEPVIERYIAHGKFTRTPNNATENGNVYLFAHREGWDGGRDFGYFRNLDKLTAGDTARILYQGKIYTYEYRESFVIDPDDTWVYTAKADTPTLTLQTCENGIINRLIVKFDLVGVESL
jgi:LPXTG-site transpeptidase (sortase) family protein